MINEEVTPKEMLSNMFILMKPYLTHKDIEALEGVRHDRATDIMAVCRKKFDGAVSYRPYIITTASYMRMFKLDPLEYAKRLHVVLYGDN